VRHPTLPDAEPRPHAAARAVAVVSSDDLLARRIREALLIDGLDVHRRAADVAYLPDDAASAAAIVLAGATHASELRAALRAAAGRFPGVPTVVVASLTETAVAKAIDAGACGVVLESELEVTLAATVGAVCTHQIVVPGAFRRRAIRPPLTHREKQTLALVAQGLTNREIATRMFLAESTVKTHIASIFGKLGVGSRSEATALVLDPDDKLSASILALAGDPAAAG
jgi:DNA-binding NarL/FixJ family response regulator